MDPYEGVDLPNAARFAGLGWAIAVAITLGFIPFFPPTDAVGDAGWPLAIATVVVLGGAVLFAVTRSVSGAGLFATSFAGIAIVTLLAWLAGTQSPYSHLYLFIVMSTALVQPPKRLALVVAVVAVARFLPAVYDSDGMRYGDAAVETLLWTGLAAFLYVLMVQLREQRAALQRYGEEAERSARIDPLTGLRNRRAFEEDIALELKRRGRTGSALSLAVLDLDGFKDINDEHGHSVGDEVLVAVADALRAETRAIDGTYRWGGDEFALVLPGSARGAGKVVCRRISERLEKESPLPRGAPVRISAGVAEFLDEQTVEQVLAQADAELFTVKRARHISDVGQ